MVFQFQINNVHLLLGACIQSLCEDMSLRLEVATNLFNFKPLSHSLDASLRTILGSGLLPLRLKMTMMCTLTM